MDTWIPNVMMPYLKPDMHFGKKHRFLSIHSSNFGAGCSLVQLIFSHENCRCRLVLRLSGCLYLFSSAICVAGLTHYSAVCRHRLKAWLEDGIGIGISTLFPWICLVDDFLPILPWYITIKPPFGRIFLELFSKHLKQIQVFQKKDLIHAYTTHPYHQIHSYTIGTSSFQRNLLCFFLEECYCALVAPCVFLDAPLFLSCFQKIGEQDSQGSPSSKGVSRCSLQKVFTKIAWFDDYLFGGCQNPASRVAIIYSFL